MLTAPDELDQDLSIQDDLRRMRLDGLPLLLLVQYVGAVALTLLPIDLSMSGAAWVGIDLTLLTVGLFFVRHWHARAAALLLVASLFGFWAAALWLYSASAAVWLAVLVIGAASTLFGSRAAFVVAGLTSLAIVAAGRDGQLPTGVALASILVSWVGACLFWLTARPAALSFEWVWSSYAEARGKRDELRRQRGELNRVLKSLDLAYQRLEHLNDELNRARRVAEEARRLKSEFAASISHELRTPLNLILGFSEMMVASPHTYGAAPLPPAYQADVDAIYRNAQHLAGLLDDVLDLSQIEAGRLGFAREWSDLAGVVEESVRVVAARFGDLGLTLEVAIAPDLPPVSLDRIRIRQILINLLNNAARFTDRGGVRVTAERRENEIVVSVADTGVGIAPEELLHVFDEFYQTGSTAQRHAGGSGLGLTVSKHLIELHGGAMWVESRAGVGSAFHFSLPLSRNVVTGTAPGEWEVWDRIARSRAPSEPELAVLVEDAALARTFERHLAGYHVRPVADARALAGLVEEAPLRGVVVTAGSPEESWRALCRSADNRPGLPVAVCTTPGWHSRAAKLGASGYLTKPVLREQVGHVLERLGKRTRTILVVDDSADMVRLLARTIRSFGRRYEVWQASGGQEALALLRERRPDAVLLDLLMPEVDGYAVLAAVRADERLRDVPVVVVSAQGPSGDAPTVGLVGITRPGGLAIDEAMGCLKGCFDALQALQAERADRSGPARPAGPDGSPASAAAPPPRESAPAPLPATPSR